MRSVPGLTTNCPELVQVVGPHTYRLPLVPIQAKFALADVGGVAAQAEIPAGGVYCPLAFTCGVQLVVTVAEHCWRIGIGAGCAYATPQSMAANNATRFIGRPKRNQSPLPLLLSHRDSRHTG